MTKTELFDRKIATIALIRYGEVHPRMMEALLRHFGNVERIIKSDSGTLMSIEGMSAEYANNIMYAADHLNEAKIFYQSLLEKEIMVNSRFDDDYPVNLFELNTPPSLLYHRGILPDRTKKIAAIAGSKKATNEGIELTTTLAKQLVEADVEIVSGLSGGISTAAHLGAKAAGGKSYALLESGHENIFPEEYRPLAIDIVQQGGLISEYPPEVENEYGNFKSTNRILAAFAQAVIITEFYEDDKVVEDLLNCCSQIGKMIFVLIDPKYGGLTDEKGLSKAVQCGAVPMVGLEKIQDIIVSLV